MRRTKSRGAKGLQLEVGARRTPRLLVLIYASNTLVYNTANAGDNDIESNTIADNAGENNNKAGFILPWRGNNE